MPSSNDESSEMTALMSMQNYDKSQYVESRSNAIETIEKTIHELGTIFSQLASMVAEQGETVNRIDSDIESAVVNVEGAQEQLVKYLRGISNNRWFMAKVFGLLIAFILIFAIFFT